MFFSSIISVFARTITFPFPFSNAFLIPSNPSTIAPVGKSGPLINSINLSKWQWGYLIRWIVASITSCKLCGGISVAYPADIPVDPLTKRLGYAAGKTVGSYSVSSKFKDINTVFLSKSLNNSLAIGESLASV